jgi:translocation protein SEC63
MKIFDVPFSNPEQDRNYRSYKLQFQAPQSTGMFTWKIYLVSDTFVGEELSRDIVLKIDDVSALNADEQGAEDEISEPDEDTLAGQMAVMRGGNAKKAADDSDEESSTGDDEKSGSSDSDSD